MDTPQTPNPELPETSISVTPAQEPEQTTPQMPVDLSGVRNAYLFLIIGTPLTFMPLGMVSAIALLALFIGIIWAYRLRFNAEPLVADHGRWMVRTFWWSSLLFALAIAVSGMIVSANADQSALVGLDKTTAQADPAVYQAAVEIFYNTNSRLILFSTLACLIWPTLYAMTRFIVGFRRAGKSVPVENVKAFWL